MAMRAGLEKVIVRRDVGEKVSSGGIVMVEVPKAKTAGEVVWGKIVSTGPHGKAGMAFAKESRVAYDVRVAKVIERGDGYLLEVIEEVDVLAVEPFSAPRVQFDAPTVAPTDPTAVDAPEADEDKE